MCACELSVKTGKLVFVKHVHARLHTMSNDESNLFTHGSFMYRFINIQKHRQNAKYGRHYARQAELVVDESRKQEISYKTFMDIYGSLCFRTFMLFIHNLLFASAYYVSLPCNVLRT